MYLPLAGINPDSDRFEKMKINSPPPILPHKLVQPPEAADPTQQRLEKITQEKPESHVQEQSDNKKGSDVEGQHWAAPSLSVQDFMSLREMCSMDRTDNEDPFKVLDEVIERLKERMEITGDILEAIKKMKEQTDPDHIALQLLTKTLEAMEQNSPNNDS